MTRFLLRDFVPQRKCWYHRKLTAHQRLVWEALAAKCLVDGKGEFDTVRIGTHDLAHRTGLHRYTVQRIIANFERFGWLTGVEAGGGRGHVAVRRLTLRRNPTVHPAGRRLWVPGGREPALGGLRGPGG